LKVEAVYLVAYETFEDVTADLLWIPTKAATYSNLIAATIPT
jgi:hypothetical protein